MEEQRATRRYPARCRAAVRGNDQKIAYGETLDVSLGGVSLLLPHNVAKGTIFSLYLQLPSQKAGAAPEVFEARAKVMYAAFSAGHDLWRLGIQFLDLAAEQQKKLDRFLQRLG